MGNFWLMAACSGDVRAGLFLEGAGKTLLTGMGLEDFSCIPETSLAPKGLQDTPTQPSFPLCSAQALTPSPQAPQTSNWMLAPWLLSTAPCP